MNKLFNEINTQKIDSNTRRQMKENGWRKASGEEEKAFLGYYLFSKAVTKKTNAIRYVLVVFLMFSVGGVGFEYICRTDLSYDPVPSAICIALSILLMLINEVVGRLIKNKASEKAVGNIYVINAIAEQVGNNQVCVVIGENRYESERFLFEESVNPMEYIHDEDGKCIGFHVLLYVMIVNGEVAKKIVLGNDGYKYYLDKYKK